MSVLMMVLWFVGALMLVGLVVTLLRGLWWGAKTTVSAVNDAITEADRERKEGEPAGIAMATDQADRFLRDIITAKQRAHLEVEEAVHAHERNFEARFSEDIKLKERLATFAREQQLDEILVALWHELKEYWSSEGAEWELKGDYPTWSVDSVAKLKVTNVEGSEKPETVSFSYDGHRYIIEVDGWDGGEELSLREDGFKVFAFRHSKNATSYTAYDITQFRKRGNWARVLIDLHRRLRIEQDKQSAEFKYSRADEIKSQFEE